MKIGFPVLRLGYLKGLGSLITLCLERGHEVVLFANSSATTNVGEEITAEELLTIWPVAGVCSVDVAGDPKGLLEPGCDVIIGLDLIGEPTIKSVLDDARTQGTRLLSVSYLYETAIRDPADMTSFDRVFYISDHQRRLHASLYPEFFNRLGPEEFGRRTDISGCTCSDQFGAVDPVVVRSKYGIRDDTPVVLLMSLKMVVPEPWRRTVWRERGKLGRTMQAVRQRRWDFIRDIWLGETYKDLCQDIESFCRRNGAVLIVKSRSKNGDPAWLKELADIYVGQDKAEYPYTSMQLLGISDLCVHFGSGAVFEAAFAGVPSLSIVVPQGHLYGRLPEYIRQLRFSEAGSIYNYPGVVHSVDHREAPSLLGKTTLSDLRIDPVQRSRYVATFMGFDDMRSAERILDEVQKGPRRA